jgi:hypothetical protein
VQPINPAGLVRVCLHGIGAPGIVASGVPPVNVPVKNDHADRSPSSKSILDGHTNWPRDVNPKPIIAMNARSNFLVFMFLLKL